MISEGVIVVSVVVVSVDFWVVIFILWVGKLKCVSGVEGY